jgi:RNA polymerase sigma factor (TIGR02999 family)
MGIQPADFSISVYTELRRLAGHYLRRETHCHSLQPTDLVHEAFLRLAKEDASRWKGRTHFLATAATAMRHILVSHARRRQALKRQTPEISLAIQSTAELYDILQVDAALSRLESQNPGAAQSVLLRYFSGLTVEEIADHIGASRATVFRQIAFGKAWLLRELNQSLNS